MKKTIRQLLLAITLLLSTSSVFAIPATEREALIALYNSTDGANWKDNTGWLGPVGTECSWAGVSCTRADGNITSLFLQSNQLSGTIPSELGQLTQLTGLILQSNQLSGTIPSELGQLT